MTTDPKPLSEAAQPCPICGHEPIWVNHFAPPDAYSAVACAYVRCKLTGPLRKVETDAIAAWNQLAAQAQPSPDLGPKVPESESDTPETRAPSGLSGGPDLEALAREIARAAAGGPVRNAEADAVYRYVLKAALSALRRAVGPLEARIAYLDGLFNKYPPGPSGCACVFDEVKETIVKWCAAHAEMREQLTAAQRENERLREAIRKVRDYFDEGCWCVQGGGGHSTIGLCPYCILNTALAGAPDEGP